MANAFEENAQNPQLYLIVICYNCISLDCKIQEDIMLVRLLVQLLFLTGTSRFNLMRVLSKTSAFLNLRIV